MLTSTEMLHVIERYRRTDFAHLVIDITFDVVAEAVNVESPGCVEQAMKPAHPPGLSLRARNSSNTCARKITGTPNLL